MLSSIVFDNAPRLIIKVSVGGRPIEHGLDFLVAQEECNKLSMTKADSHRLMPP